MEYIENFFIWAAEQFAIAYRWIGIQVIPRWNSLAYSHDMLLMLGSFLVLVLGVGLLFVHDPYWKRHPDKQYAWLEKDEGAWIGYYKIFIKAFYYPMLVYMFLLLSPFTSISLLEPTETFFFQFRELQEAYQLVLAMLLMRFVGVTIGYLVRLRIFGLLRFWIHTLGCIILGTYLNALLMFITDLGDSNLLLLIPVLIIKFLISTIPMVYFWIFMWLPLYELVMPILSIPLAIIGGIINGMQQDHQDFLDWVKEKHFFSYLLFFFWD